MWDIPSVFNQTGYNQLGLTAIGGYSARIKGQQDQMLSAGGKRAIVFRLGF
jgi:hypothetical protein